VPQGEVRVVDTPDAHRWRGCGRRATYAAKAHHTRDEFKALAQHGGPLDIVLLHDAPAGVRFDGEHGRGGYVSKATRLGELLARVRPSVAFFGHRHVHVDAEIEGVHHIGLNLVGRPGNLVAIDITAVNGHWSVSGEWPQAP
jgi:Icc-related predicted phosphoesterase